MFHRLCFPVEKKFFLIWNIILILSLSSCTKSDPSNPWSFSLGMEPIVFDPEVENPINTETGKRMDSSEDCASCHKTIFDNWKLSKHREAFTNSLYKNSHAQEPLTWCVNCHAPLIEPGRDVDNPDERYLSSEGINCQVCHVRGKKIIASHLPPIQKERSALFHAYRIEPELSKSEFCASCHQFNFPKIKKNSEDSTITYSHLPMQNTYEEFRSTEMSKMGTCSDCHLLKDTVYSHSFPGGHDREKLSESLHIQIERVGRRTILTHVIASGIAHSFPTGDLFRTLRVTVKNSKKRTIEELALKKIYRDAIQTFREDGNTPSRVILGDNRIPPPDSGYVSQNSFPVGISEDDTELEFELYMDYLNPSSRILSDLPYEETVLPIKIIKLKVPEFDGLSG